MYRAPVAARAAGCWYGTRVSIERASDLLGHASKEITKRRYRREAEFVKPVR
jgi:hypothetical protein